MGIAARRNPLFYARCGAKTFSTASHSLPRQAVFFFMRRRAAGKGTETNLKAGLRI